MSVCGQATDLSPVGTSDQQTEPMSDVLCALHKSQIPPRTPGGDCCRPNLRIKTLGQGVPSPRPRLPTTRWNRFAVGKGVSGGPFALKICFLSTFGASLWNPLPSHFLPVSTNCHIQVWRETGWEEKLKKKTADPLFHLLLQAWLESRLPGPRD